MSQPADGQRAKSLTVSVLLLSPNCIDRPATRRRPYLAGLRAAVKYEQVGYPKQEGCAAWLTPMCNMQSLPAAASRLKTSVPLATPCAMLHGMWLTAASKHG